MEQSMILNFFGGVTQDYSGWAVDFDKVFRELARWLLTIGICLLTEGIRLERWKKMELLMSYRCATVQMWWRRKFVRCLLNAILTAAVLFVTAMAADIISAVELPEEGWKVFLLWSAHVMTIMSFFPVLDLAGTGKAASAVLLLLEGFTALLGVSDRGITRFMFGMWGMYFQSGWYYGELGVSVLLSLITEGILVTLAYLTGGILQKRTARR